MDSNGQDTKQSLSARLTAIAGKSSRRDGRTSPATETSANSMPPVLGQTELRLTPSAEVSPARTSPLLDRAKALGAAAAAYGRNTGDLLANYDPATSSWRTSQLCLVEGWTRFSGTWPRSGLMRNGIAYQLPPLVPLTDETAFGSWPTPQSRDWKGAPGKGSQARGGHQSSLPAEIGGVPNPIWVEWMIGLPLGWTDCGASVMRSSPKFQKSSG